MVALTLVFAGALVAFGISVLAGGGAGLVLIPLLGLVLPPSSVPGALSIGTAVSSASRLAAFRSAVRWDVTRWFVPAALPFAILGAWLLTLLPSVYLELALGCFLIGNVTLALHRDRRKGCEPFAPARAAPRRRKAFLVAIGIVAGFLSGFTGAVGVLFNDVYIRLGLEKEEIVATRAANEIMLHLVKIATYAVLGAMSGETIRTGIVIAVAALLATPAAKRVLGRLRETLLRRLNYAAMGIAGVAMVIAAGSELSVRHGISIAAELEEDGIELSVRWLSTELSAE